MPRTSIKIISGGQTGVDRAALDIAFELGLPCGGWCPKGRAAEDGVIPPHYPLIETTSDRYALRTEWNVRDSDGTLIVTRGQPTGGTAFTVDVTERLKKPCLIADLDDQSAPDTVATWLAGNQIRVLNVAGPRESTCPGIHAQAAAFLRRVFSTDPR